MKSNLEKSPALVLLIVGALAVGTALVSGFADKPNTTGTQVATADSSCDACPMKGTEECCKTEGGSCWKDKDCASACENRTCEGHAGGCTREKAEAAAPTASGCPMQQKTGCSMGGCTLSR